MLVNAKGEKKKEIILCCIRNFRLNTTMPIMRSKRRNCTETRTEHENGSSREICTIYY